MQDERPPKPRPVFKRKMTTFKKLPTMEPSTKNKSENTIFTT